MTKVRTVRHGNRGDSGHQLGERSACADCLARSWLLGRLSGHLDVERKRIHALLDLADDDLIDAVAGKERAAISGDQRRFDADAYRARCTAAGLEVICRCDPAYP